MTTPSNQANPMIPVSAMRAIAVEAIRAVTGCSDVSNNGKHLTDELESVAQAAAASLRSTSQPGGVPEPMTRFCPGCGSVGEVEAKYHDCCPDGGRARIIPEPLARHCHDLFQLALRAPSSDDEITASPTPPAAQARERELYEALQVARDHIDMHSLEISHCKDWAQINRALSATPAAAGDEAKPSPIAAYAMGGIRASAKVTQGHIKAYADEARDYLDEAYGFAAMSPKGQENINAVSDLLNDIEGAITSLCTTIASAEAGKVGG